MIRNRDANPSRAEQDAAEHLAIAALGHLATDPHHLERFLSLSGLDPSGLREAAASSGFLAGVLDFLLEDESLLLAFAADQGLRPEAIVKARARLARYNEQGLREG
jgi:hypothetical protein